MMQQNNVLKTENSWYLGSNIEGKPVGFIPYSGGLDKYSKICKEVETNKYARFLIDNEYSCKK